MYAIEIRLIQNLTRVWRHSGFPNSTPLTHPLSLMTWRTQTRTAYAAYQHSQITAQPSQNCYAFIRFSPTNQNILDVGEGST